MTTITAPAPQESEPSTASERAGEATKIRLQTPFGEVAYDPDLTLIMPSGMPGFAGAQRFVICDLPGVEVNLKLYKCLDADDINLLVMPLPANAPLIDRSDLEDARTALAIDQAAFATLLVVTLGREDGNLQINVNLRAPVLIDADRQEAFQVVLSNPNYPMRHPVDVGA
ncbi:MAG: flagellar assembly protein FliW [Geminicoccaceae bacterium]